MVTLQSRNPDLKLEFLTQISLSLNEGLNCRAISQSLQSFLLLFFFACFFNHIIHEDIVDNQLVHTVHMYNTLFFLQNTKSSFKNRYFYVSEDLLCKITKTVSRYSRLFVNCTFRQWHNLSPINTCRLTHHVSCFC